jgi:hypothetical protein
VVWHQGLGESERPRVNTSADLPVKAVDLLRLLGRTSDTIADEIVRLWNDLQNLLPTLGID